MLVDMFGVPGVADVVATGGGSAAVIRVPTDVPMIALAKINSTVLPTCVHPLFLLISSFVLINWN